MHLDIPSAACQGQQDNGCSHRRSQVRELYLSIPSDLTARGPWVHDMLTERVYLFQPIATIEELMGLQVNGAADNKDAKWS
jgi:hypothetical protein